MHKKKFEYGMVHGRFQPVHNEHLSYIKAGVQYSENLIIGITNPEPTEHLEESSSDHRHLSESNPFSYYERQEMIIRNLEAEGCDLARIRCVPFHVFTPQKWHCYLPKPGKVVHLIRAFSEWERKKIAWLNEQGYECHLLDENANKGITATHVRELIRCHGNWKAQVPKGTFRVIAPRVRLVVASKNQL